MVCMYTILPTYTVIVAQGTRLGVAGTIAQCSAIEAAAAAAAAAAATTYR